MWGVRDERPLSVQFRSFSCSLGEGEIGCEIRPVADSEV